MTARALILALALGWCPGAVSGQGHALASAGEDAVHLRVRGDPGATLPLAEGWAPPPVLRSAAKEGAIAAAPLRCEVCAREIGYLEEAEVPPPPSRLSKRPPADVLNWLRTEQKLDPIVLSGAEAVLVIALPPMPARMASLEERDWLKAHVSSPGADLTPHQRAHLYALRYLRSEARFLDLMCLDPGHPGFVAPRPAGHLGSRSRSEIYLFPEEAPYQEFGRHFFGAFGKWSSWWWDPDQEVVVAALHAGEVSEPVFAARFDHQIGHHLLYQYRAFYSHLPIWLVEGLGHHFERRHREFEDTFCILGSIPGFEWKERNWWSAVKAMVAKGEDLPLTTLALQTRYEELQPSQHPQAWSLVNFMLGMGKTRWRRFVDIMKSKSAEESLPEVQFRAFEEAYQVDMVTFQEAWRTWVRRTRPPRRP